MSSPERLSIDALLDQEDDWELCDSVFCRFAEFDNSIDVARVDVPERVVTLAWQAKGVVGNGGFAYLFEGDFAGDPGFVYTAGAFKAIGAESAYSAIQEALALFPRSTPHEDIEERLAHFEQTPDETRKRLRESFWDADEQIDAALARYIRQQRTQIHAILTEYESR